MLLHRLTITCKSCFTARSSGFPLQILILRFCSVLSRHELPFENFSGTFTPQLKPRLGESNDHSTRPNISSDLARCGSKSSVCNNQSCKPQTHPRRHLVQNHLHRRSATASPTPTPSSNSVWPLPSPLAPVLAIYDRFVKDLESRARLVDTNYTSHYFPSTSMWGRWQGPEDIVGANSLFGCTVLMVLSRHGYYIAHFYEVPSFVIESLPEDGIYDAEDVTEEAQDEFFVDTVIEPLLERQTDPDTGETLMEPLTAMTGATLPDGTPGPLLPADEPVTAAIFTPFSEPGSTLIRFDEYVRTLEGFVSSALHGKPVRVLTYARASWWPDSPQAPDEEYFAEYEPFRQWIGGTAAGTVLAHYRRNNDSEGYRLYGPRDYWRGPVARDAWERSG